VILVAGLTPAWQQVLVFDAFTVGEVNRAREVHWCASGKVLNAARALHFLGGPDRALTVVGGTVGGAIERDLARLGVGARCVEVSAPTRVCTTILDSAQSGATELVPNAPGLSESEQAAFLTAYEEEARTASVVVLIGSLPPGTPDTFYRDCLVQTPGEAILDARGPELLAALDAKPFLVKPNREELGRTLGRDLRDDAALWDAMDELNRRGAEWVVITDGRNPVHACSDGRRYRLQAPARKVVNPIGCGDCLAAGIARALFLGQEPLDALRYGMAAAAEKVTRLLPAFQEPVQVETLARTIAVSRC
jgi:1-phosphofructokinase family hexose kinase